MAKDGKVLPEASYTRRASLAGRPLTGLVDARKALALFADGASVVLQGLHRSWPPLRDLVAELELELGHPCQANAYLTPPGSQGFAVHSDTHDVFVFQTHGSKQWEVHTPEGVEEVLLEPGLVMYLPAGTPHAARAQRATSLHVTVGINQLTWRGLLEDAVDELLEGVDDAHLPAGYLDDPTSLVAGLRERLDALADRVRTTDPEVAVERSVHRFLTTRPTRLEGGLLELAASMEHDVVEDDTMLRRRAGHPCVVRPEGDRLRLLLGDRVLEVPGHLRPAVERIRATAELRPRELDLDPVSRVVLCRRLVREGLLQAVR